MQDGELITLPQPVRCRTGLHLPLQNERRTGLAGERTSSAGSSQQVFPREFAQVPIFSAKKKLLPEKSTQVNMTSSTTAPQKINK